MKAFRFLAIATLAIISSVSVHAGAITNVVLSNIGAAGNSDAEQAFSGDVTGSNRLGFSISVGISDFTLQKINIFAQSVPNAVGTLTIYTDSSNNPSTSVVASATQTLSTNDYYTFTFSNPTLTAGTKYWAVLTATGSNASWYVTADAPTSYGSGGLSYGSTKVTGNNGSSWSNSLGNAQFAVAGTTTAAVPEPALTSLLCLGGVALIRRRMKK